VDVIADVAAKVLNAPALGRAIPAQRDWQFISNPKGKGQSNVPQLLNDKEENTLKYLLRYLGTPTAFALAFLVGGTPDAPITSVLPTVGGCAIAQGGPGGSNYGPTCTPTKVYNDNGHWVGWEFANCTLCEQATFLHDEATDASIGFAAAAAAAVVAGFFTAGSTAPLAAFFTALSVGKAAEARVHYYEAQKQC